MKVLSLFFSFGSKVLSHFRYHISSLCTWEILSLIGNILQVNKEVDDKMRTNAANVAARAAVGGDDMLSKWQLMAEQARQKKRGGGMDASSGSQPAKDVSHRSSSTSGRSTKDNQAREKKGPTSGGFLLLFIYHFS